jgi:hypothetical protein
MQEKTGGGSPQQTGLEAIFQRTAGTSCRRHSPEKILTLIQLK